MMAREDWLEWRWVLALFVGMSLASHWPVWSGEILPPLERAQWIWSAETQSECHLRRVFELATAPERATVLVTADNSYELFVNGSRVGADAGADAEVWQSVERYDITSRLVKGRNIIGLQGTDLGGVRGVVAAVRVEAALAPGQLGGEQAAFEGVTDHTWRAAHAGQPADYSHPEFVEGPDWHPARVVGPMGMAPWGQVRWSEASEQARALARRAAQPVTVVVAGAGFEWPGPVAFLADDCSVYVPSRGDAWGVAFRVGDWTRAYTEFDLPCPSKIGRKLFTLVPGPGAAPRLLLEAGGGAIGSPCAAGDGRSVLVAMARDGDKFFHLYRVPLDGAAPRQLTDGPFHDIDPAELPDGRIVFTSTRIGTFEEYHQPPSRALFRMNADGSGLHPITTTLIFDNEPKVMANGRVLFVRTDNFFDRGKVETQLHSIRPDGTDGLTEIAANVGADYGVRLRAFGYGSPAPLPDGRLAFISTRGNFVAGPGQAERDYQRLPGPVGAYGDLAALPDGRLLCTVLRPAVKGMTSDVLGLIDPRDPGQPNVVKLWSSPAGTIHSPISLAPRSRPPLIPDYVDQRTAGQPGATGFLLCQDARKTSKGKAGWDRVRAVRVLGAIPLTVRSSHSHIVHVGHETVELGTVPLAPDGSFFVEVPADMPLALQAVDAEGRSELNEMSWLYVRPGERRSCVGCHQPREAAPAAAAGGMQALRSPPLALLGQGDPHRFRGNNPGVTGLMDLQFERFRECASLNLHSLRNGVDANSPTDCASLMRVLAESAEGDRISAAQRLGLYRDKTSAPALARALDQPGRELRVAAALALATCGTRESVPPLIALTGDHDLLVAQAARLALENLTGKRLARAEWPRWGATNNWLALEAELAGTLTNAAASVGVEGDVRSVVIALGHIGGGQGQAALRKWVSRQARVNPYPVFERDNRTDNFTFAADSALNPRTLQEAVRALGQGPDPDSLLLLRELLASNLEPRTGNLFLAEAAMDALGRLGTSAAEDLLVNSFRSLTDYWSYVGWYSDHPALYACHSSPIHARILGALERLGSKRAGPIAAAILRSVPTDPDRGLFLANDDYETVVGRLLRRSGRGPEVVETCLAMLGDRAAKASPEIQTALSTTHPAWAGHPGPENRAAQVLSLVAREVSDGPRIRAAYERFLNRPEEPVHRALGNPTWSPVRHWVLFYLGRTLGQVRDPHAEPLLSSVLRDALHEARHGRPDPATPEIHLLQFEYTPCWRAAAAWALGRLGDRRATPALLGAVRNLDNAVDVRHAAAGALEALADPASLPALRALAAGYPEFSTRRALLSAMATVEKAVANGRPVARAAVSP